MMEHAHKLREQACMAELERKEVQHQKQKDNQNKQLQKAYQREHCQVMSNGGSFSLSSQFSSFLPLSQMTDSGSKKVCQIGCDESILMHMY